MSAFNYRVTHRTPGREGSNITVRKTFGRAASAARKHNRETGEPVAVWSDVTCEHLLMIAADGHETKPEKTCPDSVRRKGPRYREEWEARQAARLEVKAVAILRAHEAVERVWHEQANGWWMMFKTGWINGEALTHAHREDSAQKLVEALRFVRRKKEGDPS